MERRSNYFDYMTNEEIAALANSQHRGKPSSAYFICAMQRSGSTLLADGLRCTGVAGRPYEFFGVGEHNRDHWRKVLRISDDREYLQKVISAATTENGVCGAKLLSDQLRAFRHFLSLEASTTISKDRTLSDAISERLGTVRYIWVKRRNRAAQAISLYRASRSTEWVRTKGSKSELTTGTIEFEFQRIDQFVLRSAARDKRWEEFFRTHHIRPLVVVYEEFAQTYESSLAAVLRFLGISSSGAKMEPPRLEKQADQLSLEWEDRYRKLKLALQAKAKTAATTPDIISSISDPSPETKEAPPKLLVTRSTREHSSNGSITTSRLDLRLIATRTGWLVLNPEKFEVCWNGGRLASDLVVRGADHEAVECASSRFGAALLTFEIPYAFRTPPGFCLQVRGPANYPKDGIYPLEGIVESEARATTISINWKVTRPNQSIIFEKSEPIGLLLPLRPADMERFELEYVSGPRCEAIEPSRTQTTAEKRH